MEENCKAKDEIRQTKIITDYIQYPEGSVLIEVGKTKVLCNATIENKVPKFLAGSGKGWITAEYSLLPQSTQQRSQREAVKGKQSGRTQEIQRLIGRALRSVVDLSALGEKSVLLDCDVLQADGGTRTASITGSFVALVLALSKLNFPQDKLPLKDFVAAVSVGIVDGSPVLDLCYDEDSAAWVDMNIVMTGSGDYVEIQGTGEEAVFTPAQLAELLSLGAKGCKELIALQKTVLGNLTERVVIAK